MKIFVAFSLLFISAFAAPSCFPKTVYDSGNDVIDPTRDNKLATIDITDSMSFSMDIQVNSMPSGWASVFHCGEANAVRMPGIWLHPYSDDDGHQHEGFHVVMSTINVDNPWKNPTGPVQPGNTYSLQIIITQNSYKVILDGAVVLEDNNYDPHHLLTDVPCYSGDPWYEAADVIVSNVVIQELCMFTLYKSPSDSLYAILRIVPSNNNFCE